MYSNPFIGAVEFINRELKPDARILFVGEARGFHCERDYVAGSFYDLPPFLILLRESGTAADLRARLRREGLTHLLINKPEFSRWKEAGRWAPSAEESSRMDVFWNDYVREIYSDSGRDARGGASVYEFLESPRRGATPPPNPLAVTRSGASESKASSSRREFF